MTTRSFDYDKVDNLLKNAKSKVDITGCFEQFLF